LKIFKLKIQVLDQEIKVKINYLTFVCQIHQDITIQTDHIDKYMTVIFFFVKSNFIFWLPAGPCCKNVANSLFF
jgi:hypothetical protein